MSLFLFHLRTPAGLDPDEIGLDCPDLDAAYLEACRTVPGMAADLALAGTDPTAYAFVIADAAGRMLLEVPFTERLRSGRRPRRPPSPRGTAGEAARARCLVAEIQAQIAAMAAAAEATQEALRRSRALLRGAGPGSPAAGGGSARG